MTTETILSLSIGFGLILVTVIPYWMRMKHREARAKAAYERARRAGLNEPSSLHPVIDFDRCIGSAACMAACPEQDILGTVDGKVRLVHAARCIGHGRCFHSCPVGAISLVFGTAKRGVDIPHVSEYFETNVSGLYIAGELGGMGLIRNAVTQGRQAVAHIARAGARGDGDVLDLVVVGAGPAGLSASLEAMRHRLRFTTLDQNDFGGTIRQFPRRKLVMTQPMDIPIYGKVRAREMLKEELMGLWEDILARTGLEVRTQHRVQNVEKKGDVFIVTSSAGSFTARQVLLAIGRRGTPRKLGVPGEDLPKVAYSLLEPDQFQEMNILIVGGGDSALEAACSLAEMPGNHVTISYRREQFTRPKEAVRTRLEAFISEGRISTVFLSNPVAIDDKFVRLDCGGEMRDLPNDQVFIFAGGELPTAFLKQIGISVETKFGQR